MLDVVATLLALSSPALPSPVVGARCFETVAPLAAQAPVLMRDVVPAPCRAARASRLAYDRVSRVLRAAEPLAARAYLGRIAWPHATVVDAGTALTLRAVVGPVVIERPVTTLQPGTPGGRVFVRDAGGQVFSAPLAAAVTQDLYRDGNWPALAADRRAASVGDAITVVIQQAAEASNSTQSSTRKATDLGGSVRGGGLDESGQLNFGGGYSGRGEVRRSERLVAQLSVVVEAVLPNGDFRILGRQKMHVNGEGTIIAVRGRIRPADIASDNSIASSRIAEAEIDYNGKGFVSRSAKPGLVNQLFSLLGLG